MSHIKKLEIQGMRSYNPNKSVVMEFPKPVTVIVGHNGSGKTSIIECLKFACTGDTPSGNKGNFVHSPKLADDYQIKGQVKLEFKDILGKSTLVSRTLLTVQKAVTQTTKTLDGTIKRMGDDGKVESISMRCADLDKEMIRCLGVGKSVLNNVIFCHQEDSLWPLSEGSNVKKKFDEIFGQKRHTKCVEELRKKFKEIKSETALNNKDLEHLANNQEKAAELKEELDRVQYKLDLGRQDVQDIDKKLEDLKGDLGKLHTKVEQVQQLERKRDECATRLETVQRTKCQLEKGIVTSYPHPTEKLLNMLSSFERDFQDKRKREHEYSLRLADISESHDSAEKNMQVYSVDLGRLREAQKAHARMERDSEQIQMQLSERFTESSVLLTGGKLAVPEGQAPIPWLEEQLERARARENGLQSTAQAKQAAEYKEMDALKKKLNQAQGELNMKREARRKVKEEMDRLLVEIKDIKSSAATLSRLEQDKKAAEEELQKHSENSRLDEIASKIESKSKEMKIIAAKQSEISSTLEVLHVEAEARQDRERAEKDLASKEREMDKILTNRKESLVFHLGSMPTSGNSSKTLTKYLTGQRSQISQQRQQLSSQQQYLAKKESELKMAEKQKTDAQKSARELRDKIVAVCSNPATYEQELETADTIYQSSKKRALSLFGLRHVYSRLRDKLKKSGNCPICKTGLPADRAADVTQGLTQKVDQAPEERAAAEAEAAEAEQRYIALKSAATLCSRLKELEGEQIPTLLSRISSLSGEVGETKDRVEDLTDETESMAANESEARTMERDLDLVDRLYRECISLKDRIADLSSNLVSTYSLTLKEAIEEQARYQEEYSMLQHDHSRLTDNRTHGEAKRSALQQRCYALREQHVELNNKLQGLKGMEDRRREKAIEIQQFSQAERRLDESIKPTEENIEDMELSLASTSEENRMRQKKVSEALNCLSNDLDNARRLQQKLVSSGGADGSSLSSLSERLEQCQAEYESLKVQKKKLEAQVSQIKRELDSSQVQKRDLEGCLQIRKFEQEIQSIKDEVSDVKRQMSTPELNGARSGAQKVQDDIRNKGQQKAGTEGRNRGFNDQIVRLNRELSSDMFKDAEMTYHHQQIKCTVGQQTAKDLEMYIVAYERSIMRFHSDKMQEINKTLRDLWVAVYRGGDIDYIEIRTDDDETESASKRKTCHYRVVMNKGGVMIDMRQHSSAGQRVLAALLIRLALAETFCDNCGIITLDEPTTNLDKDNIESLAYALRDFISARERTGHFQLIVITHDEDFVELLGRSAQIEHYFKVYKDAAYFSTIMRKTIAGQLR